MNTYTIGEPVHLTAAFAVNGTATDPTSVTMITLDPTGTETTYTYGGSGTITRDSTGNYHQDLPAVTKSGVWGYRWVSTGTCATASESNFFVEPSPF